MDPKWYGKDILDHTTTNSLGNYELNLNVTAPRSDSSLFDKQYYIYASKGGYDISKTPITLTLDSTDINRSIILEVATRDTIKPFVLKWERKDYCYQQGRFSITIYFSEEMDFVNLSSNVTVTFSRRKDICDYSDKNIILENAQDFSTADVALAVFHRCSDSTPCTSYGSTFTQSENWNLYQIQVLSFLKDLSGNALITYSYP